MRSSCTVTWHYIHIANWSEKMPIFQWESRFHKPAVSGLGHILYATRYWFQISCIARWPCNLLCDSETDGRVHRGKNYILDFKNAPFILWCSIRCWSISNLSFLKGIKSCWSVFHFYFLIFDILSVFLAITFQIKTFGSRKYYACSMVRHSMSNST